MKTFNVIFAAAALGALATFSQQAAASGFQLQEQNASGLGNAYAGQAAAAENASTVFFNPAGMTRLPGLQVSGSVSGIRPSVKFSDSGASRSPVGAPEPAGGTNGGDAGSWNFLPAVYASWESMPGLWIGIGVTSPFGLNTDYDTTFIGRFQSQKTELTTYDVNPSIAWKINDIFSVGAGASYQHARFEIDRSAFIGVETASRIDLSDSQWGWNLGAMIAPGPDTRIGITYRSSIGYRLSGKVQVTGAPGFPSDGTADVRLPSTTSLALAQKLTDRWQLLGDVTYTKWSSIKSVPVVLSSGVVADTFDLQFSDSWRAGIGLSYQWSQNFTLKLGAAYDTSPVSDQDRLTALPDQDRTWLAIGAKWLFSKRATLDYGYAHLFVKDSSIDQVRGVGARPFQGAVIGNYENSVDILGIQLSYAF